MLTRKLGLLLAGMIQSFTICASDLGTTGLIDTPSARMRPDGEFGATISRQPVVDIYSLNYQATPWLETTFRYSAFEDGLFDRSYEMKLRLLEEGDVVPEVAVGIRDILGTGVFGAEYLVANKAFGPLDISIGMGWGRLADRAAFSNPVAEISDRFATRDADVGLGGTVQVDNFFAGPDVGVFGGVAYDLDKYNLRLLAEYNSDSYEREQRLGTVSDPSPLSYGLEWQPTAGVTLGLSHQFGEQYAFSIASNGDSLALPEKKPPRLFISAKDLAEADISLENYDLSSWYDRLRYDMNQSGLTLLEASSSPAGQEVTLVVTNHIYALNADAMQRVLVLADLHLPASFGTLNIILNEDGFQPITLNYRRQTASTNWLDTAGQNINILPGRELKSVTEVTPTNFGDTVFGVNFRTRFQLFDPDDPLRYQAFVSVAGAANLAAGWRLRGSYMIDIDNTFDEIRRFSNSVLPHVRSDAPEYLRQGASGLESLYFERKDNLTGDMFYRLYAGVLEEMYSGVGGELLYQPFRSRLAYGFSANWVKQRDYDKSFDHLEYDTTTAFASIYWATPWYNYDVALHAGQYLAKDLGATFEVRRTLDNGWQVGAWATLTDVPFDEFGEGSFDKGLFFQIPLGNLLGINSRGTYGNALRSIQRDGGQRLENYSGKLWFDLRGSRYDALDNNRDRMVP